MKVVGAGAGAVVMVWAISTAGAGRLWKITPAGRARQTSTRSNRTAVPTSRAK